MKKALLFPVMLAVLGLLSTPAVAQLDPADLVDPDVTFGDVTVRTIGGYGVFIAVSPATRAADGLATEVYILESKPGSAGTLHLENAFVLRTDDTVVVSPLDQTEQGILALLERTEKVAATPRLDPAAITPPLKPTPAATLFEGTEIRHEVGKWRLDDKIGGEIPNLEELVMENLNAGYVPHKASCSGSGCNGKDPIAQGCTSGTVWILESGDIKGDCSSVVGGVELKYSVDCQARWAKAISYVGNKCIGTWLSPSYAEYPLAGTTYYLCDESDVYGDMYGSYSRAYGYLYLTGNTGSLCDGFSDPG